MFAAFILLLVSAYFYAYNRTQIPSTLAAGILEQNSTVYYSDGTTPIGTYGTTHRQILAFSQIPKTVQDAVLAAEDRNFWTEGGISPTGILRAAYDDLTNSGGSLAGGSTITQQFVRNYYDIGHQQTVSRKLKEIFVAQKLAKEKSKQWILTNYLNTIFLGKSSYGVAAAAQTYFGVPLSKLTVAQAAVIAAIIQQPANYPQQQYRSALVGRWHYVLAGMVTMGDITADQATTMKFPKLLTDAGTVTRQAGTASGNDPWAPYILNVVANELEGIDHITQDQLDTGGYKIVTTISRPMEAQLYKAVEQNVKLIHQEGFTLPWYAMIGAELQNPGNGAIIAIYPGRGQNMTPKECALYKCDLNTAVYAREQVGSSFKPYVLATAVSEGMNVQTSILNASPHLWVPPDWQPMVLSATDKTKALPSSFPVSNDAGETIAGTGPGGATSVTNALAQSSNTAYTDLAHRAGTRAIIDMAANMGVNIASFPNGSGLQDKVHQVGMALGTGSLTVNEQATMLSTIANGGTYHSAHLVATYQAANGPVHRGIVTQHEVLTPSLDSQVQYAMSQTTVNGTGTAAAMGDGRPIIGKTGTTTNSKAAFFIGAIPQYSLAVGIFTQSQKSDSPQSLTTLGGGGFGGTWPAAIWHTFAEAVFAKLPQQQFLSPVFTGAKWDQVGKLPPKKKPRAKKPPCPFPFGCPSATPTRGRKPRPSGPPTVVTSPSLPGQTSTASPTPTVPPTGTATTTPPGGGTPVGATQAGLALGGALTVLPGSLLWTRMSRRRRKRRPSRAG
jgi:membrane peptidoglycan carboxypeptidase